MYMRKRCEATEQEHVIEWCMYRKNAYPELELIFHVPNGGSRNKLEASNLKRQGVKAGVPDLVLPVSRGMYHGMFLEMKFGTNKVQQSQKKWLEELKKQGYYTVVCYGAENAVKVIEEYLNLKSGTYMSEEG